MHPPSPIGVLTSVMHVVPSASPASAGGVFNSNAQPLPTDPTGTLIDPAQDLSGTLLGPPSDLI